MHIVLMTPSQRLSSPTVASFRDPSVLQSSALHRVQLHVGDQQHAEQGVRLLLTILQ
jgi:hypothetical protein